MRRLICRSSLIAGFTMACCSLTGGTTFAQDATAAPDASAALQWRYRLSPYLWLSGIRGDFGAQGRTIHANEKFTDIFHDVKFAGMLNFEARREKLSLLLDLVYTDVREDTGVLVPLPGAPTPVPGTLDVKTTTLIISPVAGWRVDEDAKGFMDILVGARIWIPAIKLKLNVPGVGEQSFKGNPTWVDPTIGGRARIALSPKWTASVTGDIGGFGVGSKFTYQVAGAFNLSVGRRDAVTIGYRVLDVDYRKGGTTYNATQYGPILGYSFGF